MSANCLDKSSALGFEEGDSLFAFTGSSYEDDRKLSLALSTCLRFPVGCHFVAALVAASKIQNLIRNIGGMLYLSSHAKVMCDHYYH